MRTPVLQTQGGGFYVFGVEAVWLMFVRKERFAID
jgi:hypothetical protein